MYTWAKDRRINQWQMLCNKNMESINSRSQAREQRIKSISNCSVTQWEGREISRVWRFQMQARIRSVTST